MTRQSKSGRPAGGRAAVRELRHQQLIDATIESIAKRGFSGTTLSTVTAGADLSHGVANFYFESKEALYLSTLGYLADEHYELWLGAMRAAGGAPADQLRAIVTADFNPKVCSRKKLAVWFAFWGQVQYRPNYLDVHGKHDHERYVEMRRLCAEIIEEGDYQGLDPTTEAHGIEAIIDGYWLNLLLYPKELSRKEALGSVLTHLARTFPGHFTARNLQAEAGCFGCDSNPGAGDRR
jgi:TetR/AcrR family transcriptional repressor of bet genes